jgi:hypothetical protein
MYDEDDGECWIESDRDEPGRGGQPIPVRCEVPDRQFGSKLVYTPPPEEEGTPRTPVALP